MKDFIAAGSYRSAGQTAILACVFMGVALAQAPLESPRWEGVFAAGMLPSNSLPAGTDDGGAGTLYSCRAKPFGGNDYVLGKFRFGYKGCLIATAAGAEEARSYEVLKKMSVRWVDASGSTLPPGAIEGVVQADGVKQYICRATPPGADGQHLGRRTVSTCDVEWYGRQHKVATFQVLTYPWTSAANGVIPAGAFESGTDVGGLPLHPCRGSYLGGIHIGKIQSSLGGCFIESFGQSVSLPFYEVLTNFAGNWTPGASGSSPQNPFYAGIEKNPGGEGTLDQFICRAVPPTPAAQGTRHTGKFVPRPTEPNSGRCWVEFGKVGYAADAYEVLVAATTPATAAVTPVSLSATPTSASFTYQAGGLAPVSQSISITSPAAAAYTVDALAAPWLSVTPMAGSTPGTIMLHVDPNGLQPGQLSTRITIRAANAPPLSIPVTLLVTPPPQAGNLSATPAAIAVSAQAGAAPAPQQVAITVPAGAPNVAFTVETGAPWVSVTPSVATTPAALMLSFNPNLAPSGPASTQLLIRPMGQGAPAPITIAVTLSVVGGDPPESRSQLISQIADGEGWRTTIMLVNRDPEAAPFTLRFWSGAGTPMALAFDGNPGPKMAVLQGTLPAGGSRIIQTQGFDPVLTQGWAELISSKSVGAVTLFRSQQGQEAGVGLTSGVSQFFLPFDNTQSQVTSMALVNSNGAAPVAVTVSLRDEFGSVLSTETLALAPRGHSAFSLPLRFPAIANRRGVAEFSAATPDITALGLRFASSGAFTSFPVQSR